MEYYKKVYIKDESDLPKEEGKYFIGIKEGQGLNDISTLDWIPIYEKGDLFKFREIWLDNVDWYLQPITEKEINN